MKIGMLGGSFNPPHVGHIFIAQQILDFTDIEKIWLLPAYRHTFAKELCSSSNRLAMTRYITNETVELSTLEIDNHLDGNTIHLIPILKKQYPYDSFTFIIGSDNLPTFTKWGRWEELLTSIPFLVVSRAGYPMEPLYENMTPLTHPLFVTTNISSTMVRNRIKEGLSIDHFVTPEVKEYIERHHLYKE